MAKYFLSPDRGDLCIYKLKRTYYYTMSYPNGTREIRISGAYSDWVPLTLARLALLYENSLAYKQDIKNYKTMNKQYTREFIEQIVKQ